MPVIHFLQRFAALVAARDAVVVVLLIATVGTAVRAHLHAPTGLRRHRLALGAVALGSLVLLVAPRGWLPATAMAAIVLAMVTGFSLHALAEARNDNERMIEEPVPQRGNTMWIGAASFLAILFLFSDLGGYSGTLMVWEPESMRGLVEAWKTGTSLPRYTASRLFWGQGLMSSGFDSLLYGPGTYALWKIIGASSTTLRLAAAFFTMACLPLAFRLGMRLGGVPVGRAAMIVLAVNPALIFYGRYGVALSATLFAVLLLLLTCERMIASTRVGWWYGFAAAGAAVLATLGYAPGRVVTVVVVTMTLLFGAWSWPRLGRNKRLAFVLMVTILFGVSLTQVVFGTPRDFIDVRGEQVMSVTPKPDWVKRLLDDPPNPERLTVQQRLVMAGHATAERLPQLKTVLSFSFIPAESAWHVVRRDPPDLPLIQGPLLLFAVWGFLRSLFEWRRGWPLLLVAALAAASLPLLLTNRVDIHRMCLASLPVIVWAALGVAAAGRVAHGCGVPGMVRHGVAAVVIILVAADNSTFLFFPTAPPRSHLAAGIHSEIDNISEPVVIGLVTDPGPGGEIQLALIDRQRRYRDLRGEFLSDEMVEALTGRRGPHTKAIVQIEEMLDRAAIILAPREPFEKAARVLESRGARVRSIGDRKAGWWQMDRAYDLEFDVSDHSHRPTTTDERESATPDRSLSARIPLTRSHVREANFGFKAPRFGTAFNGRPITMGGVTHSAGIGMHAWTHMHVAVPDGAIAFEATIGLSDAVSDCDRALVTFEVWDEDDKRIFRSRSFGQGTPPQRIRVPLNTTGVIELVLSEGGNGSDCDHGNWAEPIFVLDR